MSKRKLKRQLNLLQVIMLGTAGTIAAEIFVLTGHAAGMAGPATVLALLIGGILSYSVALNYCELATAYPEAGGAMSYVREAFGNGLLSFLVGSMDCISSTFYAALSAVGFAYSLQIFIPGLPIIPVAVTAIGVFMLLNILGVTQVGNAQIVLGGILLSAFAIFVVAGLTRPTGFRWDVFLEGETIFAHQGFWPNFSRILATIALVYNAYVGFEVIADDAEEISNPSHNIPLGILISLTLCTIIYVSVALVTLGTVPWRELAGSETALTDAVQHFIPGWGVPMMAIAGMIATLTSINSAMLSATREAFTLGRDGVWPRMFSKLSRFRTPVVSILIIGGISALIAAIGIVDFLSYISSSGYLFVLFWGSLSLVRLRKLHPDIERPFKVPFFPLTVYMAGATCVLIIAFADWRALLFGAGVLVLFTIGRYIAPHLNKWIATHIKTQEPEEARILIAAASPATIESLTHLATIIAQATEDSYICVMSVIVPGPDFSLESARWLARRVKPLKVSPLNQIAEKAFAENVPLYTKLRAAPTIADGILEEIESRSNVRWLLIGWPGPVNTPAIAENPVKIVLQKAHTNVGVVLDRGLRKVQHILVPVGGGAHSKMALRLAYEIAEAEGARITALRVLTAETRPGETEAEEVEDKTFWLGEMIEEALESIPECFELRVTQAATVPEGILAEATQQPYDLMVIGASEEWMLDTRLFGSVDDWVAEHAPCSVVLCRRHESVPLAWLRYRVKVIEREYASNGQLH
ncbi:MAG TPA: amino acid permease [Anaerolineae bacterium]|nr:amino acid permease [Anaerolineae bacterium]HQH37685.1 amino acid permease [Anaerolineae bacterium]